jgi:predicted trehalose synthase
MREADLTDDPLWYKDAIIYELHVRSFADSNADGVGDFKGLTERLDYLQDLGVTALWLLPFYPSPLRDDGYDIADYASVNPAYGTLRDFKRFLKEAHRRGLRVIIELVINHTSVEHAWFQHSRCAKPGTKWRDFYVWSETPHKYQDARIIFRDFETSNWTWDPVAQAYYWHRFYSHQPDLNFNSPAVRQAVLKVVQFWMDMGVDGMRLDAGPNPELEVGRFLTEKSAYPHISPVGGCLEYCVQNGQGATLAMLQGFVPNQGDGWSLTLRALDQYFERALAWGDPPGVVTTSEPLLERASRKLPPEVVEAVGAYLPLVELLGRRTAELHLALAADRNDPNFAPEPFSLLQQRALYQSARSRLSQTLALIGKRLKSLPSEATLLVDREPELEAILARILSRKIGATCVRCHGDYHLGQILYTGKDFVIIDFEGEPGRSLGERRFKRSALLDVAGMLRSFHYATVAGLRRERIRSQDRPRLRPWAELWHASVGATFLRAYLTSAGPAPFIPRETEQLSTLLDYHVVDKCLYELGYELNNRPDWIQIPLEGIRALLQP